MTPILHQYDFSTYSEKVRLAFGWKRLAWRAVEIPAWAPKPEYTPLTAGYRRTPALQLGADVYCDTSLIADVLEGMSAHPTLYPGATPALGRAQCAVHVAWAEQVMFRPLALYITGLEADRFPLDFHLDRARLHRKPPPDLARVRASAARHAHEALAQLARIELLLDDERPYLLGAAPGLADFAAYVAPWFLERIGGRQAFKAAAPRTRAWQGRVADIGHGPHAHCTAAEALAEARASEPAALAQTVDPASGFAVGDAVRVSPLGEDAPATGRLVGLDAERIVIAHEEPAVGRVHVHFPRLGYRIGPASSPRARSAT